MIGNMAFHGKTQRGTEMKRSSISPSCPCVNSLRSSVLLKLKKELA